MRKLRILPVLALAGLLSGCEHKLSQSEKDALETKIDNVVVLMRHGRNPPFAPFNLNPGEELKICSNMAEWSVSWGKRFCGVTDGSPTLINYLEPEYETDLPAGTITTTNRFQLTAYGAKIGLAPPLGLRSCRYPGSSLANSKLLPQALPVANSVAGMERAMSKFQIEDKTRKVAIWQAALPEQKRALRALLLSVDDEQKVDPDTFGFKRKQISVYVLARSALHQLANDLHASIIKEPTPPIDLSPIVKQPPPRTPASVRANAAARRDFAKEINDNYTSGNDDYFYDQYWIIYRHGLSWVRYETLRMKNYEPARIPGRCTNALAES